MAVVVAASIYSLLLAPIVPSGPRVYAQPALVAIDMPQLPFVAITVGLLLVSMAGAIVLPQVELVLALSGCTVGVLISYVLPALCYNKVHVPTIKSKVRAHGSVVFCRLLTRAWRT